MDDMTIEAFRRRLKTLKPDEATLERVSRTLVESTDERLKEPVVIEMVERFLLVSTDSPDEIGTERRLKIFMNAGNKRVSSAVLGERGVKNAFIQKFGYGKYLDAAVSSGIMDEDERKRIEEANERMFEAAGRGDIAGIEAALNSGADICARDNDGWTVAMYAAWHGHITPELVECLVKRGCPMDARDNDGRTVAMIAARYGHLTPELVECLVKHECPMDARDNDGWTVAMQAAWNGHLTPELVECLVKHGCPMDARDDDGWTVAVFAAWNGHLAPELVECLVKKGCSMDDIRIGKTTASRGRFASFAAWSKYAPGMALQALDSFSNAEKRAAGALALLSSETSFDEENLRSLAETFSKSRGGAVEHLLGDKDIFRAIDGARFLELVCSGNVLETPMNVARACNLLSMFRSLLDEHPEKLNVVKTSLLKTFAATFEACANDPEVAGLLQETMGRMAAIEEENSYSGPDEIPCL